MPGRRPCDGGGGDWREAAAGRGMPGGSHGLEGTREDHSLEVPEWVWPS